MHEPRSVLMCSPDYFDVVDVKNPFMVGKAGTVDRERAGLQWAALKRAFEDVGMPVETLPPTPGCEDMVFSANQTFPGLDRNGRRICVMSRMKYESRRREVAAYGTWFVGQGYDVLDAVPEGCLFEGCGDALWHPGRHEIWAGYGHRTERAAHRLIAELYDAPVHTLHLVDDRFYHLDTCLCALDEHTALVYPGAFEREGYGRLRESFGRLLDVEEDEAAGALACNATALPSGHVLIDQRAVRTIAQLDEAGYSPVPVDTGEFLKSGGSVFCMKQFVY